MVSQLAGFGLLDLGDVFDVRLLGHRPFEHPKIRPPSVCGRAAVLDLGEPERSAAEPTQRALSALAGGRDRDQLRVRPLVDRARERLVDPLAGDGLELVEDHQARREAVKAGRLGSEDPHVAGKDGRLVGVGAEAQLQMPEDEVGVLEPAREVGRVLVKDPGLRDARRDAVDPGVRVGEEVVNGDQGHQRRLAVSPGKQDQRLALLPEDGVGDPLLKRLEFGAELLAEVDEAAITATDGRLGPIVVDQARFSRFRRDCGHSGWGEDGLGAHAGRSLTCPRGTRRLTACAC